MFIFGLILSAFCLLGIALVVIYQMARRSFIFTFPVEGENLYVVKGDSMIDVASKVSGYFLDTDGKLKKLEEHPDAIGTTPAEKKAWADKRVQAGQPMDDFVMKKRSFWLTRLIFWKTLGIYLIGIPGYHRLHKFKMKRNRLRAQRTEGTQDLAHQWIEFDTSQGSIVSSLRWKFPRPIHTMGTELPQDNATIDVVMEALFQVTMPSKPIFALRGDFMSFIEGSVAQALINVCRTFKVEVDVLDEKGVATGTKKKEHLSYREFVKIDFTGTNGLVEKIIDEANALIEEPIGIKVTRLVIHDWQADEETEALAQAMREEETKKALARGKIAEAHGDAEYIRIKALQEVSRLAGFAGAVGKEGAAEIGANEALRDTAVTTQKGAVNVNL